MSREVARAGRRPATPGLEEGGDGREDRRRENDGDFGITPLVDPDAGEGGELVGDEPAFGGGAERLGARDEDGTKLAGDLWEPEAVGLGLALDRGSGIERDFVQGAVSGLG